LPNGSSRYVGAMSNKLIEVIWSHLISFGVI
jgi:hypothetical protein